MSEIAVRVEELGKLYHIGAQQERYRTLRDNLADALVAPFRRAANLLKGHATGAAELHETIWALKDISFQVEVGEVVGIIGANGAGKSTLLKVLSRITEPTEGFAEIRGRVGSLLEVGTGFHPELTGRDNIFLNGAILGMRRAEIARNFDAIVAFAEIEKFIDTPVKHYSSGMYVRLAFAVAAHLDPEILVVDEVLSVGDAAFQRKCLGKMGEVSQSGRTVLFVSHNMAAVADLCDRAILLEQGRISLDSDPAEVISAYLSAGTVRSGEWIAPVEDGVADPAKDGTGGAGADVRIESVRLLSDSEEPTPMVPFDQSFRVQVAYEVRRPVRGLVVLCAVANEMNTPVFTSWDTDGTGWAGRTRDPGHYVSTCTVPAHFLRPGTYHLSVVADIPRVRPIDKKPDVLSFDVSWVGYPFNNYRRGIITPLLEWEVDRREASTAGVGRRS